MNAQQLAALEAVAGRQLTAAEQTTLAPLVAIRNDVEIARIISAGRVKYTPTQIGVGTVMAVMGGERGGDFLDAVNNRAGLDRQVHWGFEPVRRGVLDISIPAARAMLGELKTKMDSFAGDIDKLLKVGVVPDLIDYNKVSDALNALEGSAI